MPKFFVNFTRRKSPVDERYIDPPVEPGKPSFRVLTRPDYSSGKSFDGGARLARASGYQLPRVSPGIIGFDEKTYSRHNRDRGSEASSNNLDAVTDASSRQSTSTAPSSVDMGILRRDSTLATAAKTAGDEAVGPNLRSTRSSLLDKAGKTLSFGIQRRPSVPLRTDEPHSSRETELIPRLGNVHDDLGGDFGNLLATLDRFAEPAMSKSESYDGFHHNAIADSNPERHGAGPSDQVAIRPHNSYRGRTDVNENDSERMFLQDSIAATRFLEDDGSQPETSGRRFSRQEPTAVSSLDPKPTLHEENMFHGSISRPLRLSQRYTRSVSALQRNKVMTSAQYEQYRADRENQSMAHKKAAVGAEDDGDDDINYDDDEDECEKLKQQAQQKRKQEAHMAVYRQQMMKVTGDSQKDYSLANGRPAITTSFSEPHLTTSGLTGLVSNSKTEDDDGDEEVPLAILQAHGFPNKSRAPSRLTMLGSNTDVRGPSSGPGYPVESSITENRGQSPKPRRPSPLPAFARSLPQDPFIGASVSQPAIRESMNMGGGAPAPVSKTSAAPGGLVGIIANEERAKAMRRASPSVDQLRRKSAIDLSMHADFPHDPLSGASQQMLHPARGSAQYGQAYSSPASPAPMISAGEQAQIQVAQQMQQFMQMQMQFMQQRIATEGTNRDVQPLHVQPPPLSHGNMPFRHPQSGDSLRSSMMPGRNPNIANQDESMRRRSMMSLGTPQMSAAVQHQQSPPRTEATGYATSIAPSERSNIGLPGRYRPVSQDAATLLQQSMSRTNSMPNMLGQFEQGPRAASALGNPMKQNIVQSADEDDDEGWAAMKAKRDKKKSTWKSKRASAMDWFR